MVCEARPKSLQKIFFFDLHPQVYYLGKGFVKTVTEDEENFIYGCTRAGSSTSGLPSIVALLNSENFVVGFEFNKYLLAMIIYEKE